MLVNEEVSSLLNGLVGKEAEYALSRISNKIIRNIGNSMAVKDADII